MAWGHNVGRQFVFVSDLYAGVIRFEFVICTFDRTVYFAIPLVTSPFLVLSFAISLMNPNAAADKYVTIP
jgi:hypothetical protein